MLKAYQHFLENYPPYRNTTCLILYITPFDNSKYVNGQLILKEEDPQPSQPNNKYKNAMDRVRNERQIISFVQDAIDDVIKLVKQIQQ